MYRVIREGNYTGFPGFYGVLMRHCNTLPLSSNFKTMEDSDVLDDDGFYVQEYTVHFCEPIYPDPNKKRAQNSCEMRDKNYEAWKAVYERTYGEKLTYSCDEEQSIKEKKAL